MEYLARFNFTWEYLSGSLNVADALSRHPSLHAAILSVATCSESADQPFAGSDFASHLKRAYATDPWFTEPLNTGHLRFANGLWIRCEGSYGQIVVPTVTMMPCAVSSCLASTTAR